MGDTELTRAWRVLRPGPMSTRPLQPVRESPPRPAAGELLVRVLACAVCRTDLHVAEGDLPVHHSAILFAPAGELVPSALAALDRGGTLALAGIHLTDIPVLRYQQHLFPERQIRSVTANTRQDGDDFLGFAAAHRLHVATTHYALDQADVALADLATGRVHGAAILIP